ncbi:MAG: helix-turn-helix transcriptional regulator [Solobacterium sp.]|nr:helix-turn-helix transcriptional regulator [Solobacterium sp.]
MILGEKITELRKRSGLSQEQLGDRLGVSRQAVSKWEMSQAMPDLGRILAMSEFFEVPADFLLKDIYMISLPWMEIRDFL